MIKSLFIILLIGGVSIRYADLGSESSFVAVFLPVVAVLSLMAFALWVVVLIHRRGFSQNASSGDAGGVDYSGDGCGGD